MSCANNVLPVYMWPSPGKIPEALCLPPVQVDTLHFSSEATETNGFSRLSSSLNRTAVGPFDSWNCLYGSRIARSIRIRGISEAFSDSHSLTFSLIDAHTLSTRSVKS